MLLYAEVLKFCHLKTTGNPQPKTGLHVESTSNVILSFLTLVFNVFSELVRAPTLAVINIVTIIIIQAVLGASSLCLPL